MTQNNGHYVVQGHLIQGHRFRYQSEVLCDFLLVNNTNLHPVSHRFRDVKFMLLTGNIRSRRIPKFRIEKFSLKELETSCGAKHNYFGVLNRLGVSHEL